MSNQSYNGWTNKQTWNISLRYGEIFADMAEEQEYDDVEHMADSFESLVNELEFDGLRDGSLAHEAVGYFLDVVNWQELAEHFFEDKVSEEDYDRMQEIADSLEVKRLNECNLIAE